MSKAEPVIRIERGQVRLEIAISSDSFRPGSAVVVVREWQTFRELKRAEAGKLKHARKLAQELLHEQLADGFVVAEEPWVEPPSPAPLRYELLPGESRITPVEAEELTHGKFTELFDLDRFDEVIVHHGNVHGEQLSIEPPVGAYLVVGDVIVNGSISDWEGSLLLVSGKVLCRSAWLCGEVVCAGGLIASEFVYVNSSNDYGFSVGGTLTAKIFIEGGMASFASRFNAEVWRTMNAVVDSTGPLAMTPPERRTRRRLHELGLDEEAIDELCETLGLE